MISDVSVTKEKRLEEYIVDLSWSSDLSGVCLFWEAETTSKLLFVIFFDGFEWASVCGCFKGRGETQGFVSKSSVLYDFISELAVNLTDVDFIGVRWVLGYCGFEDVEETLAWIPFSSVMSLGCEGVGKVMGSPPVT